VILVGPVGATAIHSLYLSITNGELRIVGITAFLRRRTFSASLLSMTFSYGFGALPNFFKKFTPNNNTKMIDFPAPLPCYK